MKIAIHNSKGSFSTHFISYCEANMIQWKPVDCYSSNIIQQIEDCDVLLWHFHQANSKDHLFARQLLYSVAAAGKKVFPDFKTSWHFDDKVGQKYLLEAVKAPLVTSYVFYDKREALSWTRNTTFPKVAKLRRGAASGNVRLIKSRHEADSYVRKAFRSGFRQYNPYSGFVDRWRIFRSGRSGILDLLEALGHFFIRTRFEKVAGKEKGYVYFQDFIEGCRFDIRVKVIGNKCWAFRRMVRENDFRASGSHLLVFSKDEIPLEVVKISLNLSKKLSLQSVAFDFLLLEGNSPYITEMSYAFGYDEGENYGYWDSDLNWHEGEFDPFVWIMESILEKTAVKT